MIYTSLFAALLAALSTAEFIRQEGPVGSDNPTSHPGLNEQVPIGAPYEIKWANTTPGLISLYLLRGPGENIQYLSTIQECIPNTGSYTWNPDKLLEPDVTHYGIRLDVCVDGKSTSNYQYSPQFGMKKSDDTSSSSSVSETVTSSTTSSASSTATSSSMYTSSTATEYSSPSTTDYAQTTVAASYNSYENISPQSMSYGGSEEGSNPTIVYSTHYTTYTSCDCSETGVPSSTDAYGTVVSGMPQPSANSSAPTNSYTPPGEVYQGTAANVKLGGAILAIAAGAAVFLL